MKRRLTACTALLLGLTISAAEAFEIVSVEETWSFTVGAPDVVRNSPQVSNMMGPFNTTSGLYFTFTLNHGNAPSYTAGGMQIQVWNDETLLSHKSGPITGSLHHSGETVRWTQRLSTSNGNVTFEVKSGTSESWGNFGGQGFLKTTVPGVTNLNQYRPYLSLKESSVAFGGNRVSSFQLEKILWTLSTGQQFQLLAPIDIDADLDP